MWSKLKQYWWVLVFYAVVIAVIMLWGRITVNIDQNMIILLIILLLPLLIPRLAKIEWGTGGFKLELRELRKEFVETKEETRKIYQNLSERLARLAEKSADYLKQQPLEVSDEKAEQMIRTINLSDEEVELGLNSFDANLRVPSYIELQVRPRKHFFHPILDCFWLEYFLARTQKETRPLWRLIVTTGRFLEHFPTLSKADKERARLVLRHTLEFLQSDDAVDPGRECERWTKKLLESFY